MLCRRQVGRGTVDRRWPPQRGRPWLPAIKNPEPAASRRDWLNQTPITADLPTWTPRNMQESNTAAALRPCSHLGRPSFSHNRPACHKTSRSMTIPFSSAEPRGSKQEGRLWTRQMMGNPPLLSATSIPCLESSFLCFSCHAPLSLWTKDSSLVTNKVNNVLARFPAPAAPVRLAFRGLNLASPSRVAKTGPEQGFRTLTLALTLSRLNAFPCSPERAGSLRHRFTA